MSAARSSPGASPAPAVTAPDGPAAPPAVVGPAPAATAPDAGTAPAATGTGGTATPAGTVATGGCSAGRTVAAAAGLKVTTHATAVSSGTISRTGRRRGSPSKKRPPSHGAPQFGGPGGTGGKRP